MKKTTLIILCAGWLVTVFTSANVGILMEREAHRQAFVREPASDLVAFERKPATAKPQYQFQPPLGHKYPPDRPSIEVKPGRDLSRSL